MSGAGRGRRREGTVAQGGRRRPVRDRRTEAGGPVAEAPEPVREVAEPEPAPGPPSAPEPKRDEAPAPRAAPVGGSPLYDRLWASGLPKVWAIARRELGAFFVSPIGYVMGAALVVLVSALSYLPPLSREQALTMNDIFNLVELLMVFVAPLYTMRLLAEERRAGTLEMMLTSPVRDWELVAGKWLGGFVCYLATVAFTLAYVVLLAVQQPLRTDVSLFGLGLIVPNLDYGAIAAGYVGLLLVGAAWIAIGLLASSLTSNQIIAAVLGIAVLFILYAAIAFLPIPIAYQGFFDYVNANTHAAAFGSGRLALADAVYFLSLTVGALFVATRVIESRRWR